MKIVDLTEDKKDLFCLCLEDWSEEAKEAGPKRRQWLERSEKLGLRAKLALDDNGVEGGMIQYGPIEHSFVDGAGLYFIYCIHVHGHKQGRGNFQRRGMGKALLRAAEEDARAARRLGMAAWGVWLPFWMKASWFKKHGYRKADRQGISVLLWKPFADEAQPPRWFPKVDKRPEPDPRQGERHRLHERLVPGAEPGLRAGQARRGRARRRGRVPRDRHLGRGAPSPSGGWRTRSLWTARTSRRGRRRATRRSAGRWPGGHAFGA